MKKYRKKPVVIEAWQLTKQKALDCFLRRDKAPYGLYISGEYNEVSQEVYDAYVCIDTLEGKRKASLGDYIIKGVQGELYPCKPDIFEQTYEEVNDTRADKTN